MEEPLLLNSQLFIGLVAFPLTFVSSVYVLEECNGHGLQGLNKGDIYTMSMRFVSALQAVLACVSGIVIMMNTREDMLYASHWLANGYIGFCVPYFYYDSWAMYLAHWHTIQSITPEEYPKYSIKSILRFLRGQKLMMFHHIFLPTIIYPILVLLRNNVGDFFIGCFLLVELPIPFISLRAVMLQLKVDPTTRFSIINGIVLIVTYTVSRVLIFPFLFWRYSSYKGISIFQVPFHIPIKCSVISAIFLVFNLIWVNRMIIIAIKTARKISLGSSKSQEKLR